MTRGMLHKQINNYIWHHQPTIIMQKITILWDLILTKDGVTLKPIILVET